MTTAELTREITFEPATGLVGAWVHGVGLDERNPKVAERFQERGCVAGAGLRTDGEVRGG